MSHSHSHSHGDAENTYFLDQLFTITVSGLIGIIGIVMFLQAKEPQTTGNKGILNRILIPDFFPWVLGAGIALVVMVLLRAIGLWRQAASDNEGAHSDTAAAHEEEAEQIIAQEEHSHAHGHEHSHAHAHEHPHAHGHEHSHSHGHEHSHAHEEEPEAPAEEEAHDHGWAPWKYVILLLPSVLFFLDLPKAGYSKEQLAKEMERFGKDEKVASRTLGLTFVAGGGATVARQTPDGIKAQMEFRQKNRMEVGFDELSRSASMGRHEREKYTGKIVTVRGQFKRGSDTTFALYRVKMNCCIADAVMSKFRIISPDVVQGIPNDAWVEVEGEVRFRQDPQKQDAWVTEVIMESPDSVKPCEPEGQSF